VATVHREVLAASAQLAAEEIEGPAALAVMRFEAGGGAIAKVAEFLQLRRRSLIVDAEERE